MTLRDGFPPFYPERPSSVMFEPSQVYLGYAAAALFVGLLLILPGVRGRNRIFFLIRWTVSLFIGVSIIACVQGISWHVAVVNTVLPYQAQARDMARFEVGLKIGLSTFNVTLKGDLDDPVRNKFTFSEQFKFLNSDEALTKGLQIGLPFPILNVLEHFSVKRVTSLWLWGRRYWIAGHYSSYMLWSAFAAWVLANILLHTVLRYGGLAMLFTGLLMVGANAAYTSIRAHGCHLEIHLGYYNPAVMSLDYGWCFWLCLGVGLLCIVLGTIIFLADHCCAKSLKRFYGVDKEEVDLYDVDVDTKSWSRHTSQSQSSEGETNYCFLSTEKRKSISVISTLEEEPSSIEETSSTIQESPMLSDKNNKKSVQNDQPESKERQPTTQKNFKETSVTLL